MLAVLINTVTDDGRPDIAVYAGSAPGPFERAEYSAASCQPAPIAALEYAVAERWCAPPAVPHAAQREHMFHLGVPHPRPLTP